MSNVVNCNQGSFLPVRFFNHALLGLSPNKNKVLI